MRYCHFFCISPLLLSASLSWSISDHWQPSTYISPGKSTNIIQSEIQSELSTFQKWSSKQKAGSYEIRLSVAGIPTYIHQKNNDQNGLQTAVVNLRGLAQKKDTAGLSLTHIEKLLLLLAKHYRTATITLAPQSGAITIKVRDLVVETFVSGGEPGRNDLPELLREDIAQSMFLAMECVLDNKKSEVNFSIACYSGLLQRNNNKGTVVFEAKPAYQVSPHEWSILEQNNKLIRLKSGTTQVVLTINQDGIPYRGDVLSSNEVMDSPPDKQKQQQQQQGGQGAAGNNSNNQSPASGFSSFGASLPDDDDDPNYPKKPIGKKLNKSHYQAYLGMLTSGVAERNREDVCRPTDYPDEYEFNAHENQGIAAEDTYERESFYKRYVENQEKRHKLKKRNRRQQDKEDQRQLQEEDRQKKKYFPDDVDVPDIDKESSDIDIDKI